MKKFIFVLLFLFFASQAQAKTYGDLNNVTFVDCYDGDTCYFNIPEAHPIIGDRIGVRIRGIDAPEIKGKCELEKKKAIKARDFVIKILSKAKKIDLKKIKRGKYFRIVATIIADGVDVSKELVKNNLAVRYKGKGRKVDWCNWGL